MKAIIFPGQGAQYKGMGKDLFHLFKTETQQATAILGFDLEELCIHDPHKQLGLTQYTQPALYTVNAFTYFMQRPIAPRYVTGHSLGEYNALLAAGAFDFITGLKLVKKRGELMAASSGGSMAAVLGVTVEQLRRQLKDGGFHDIDIANYNTPTQTVISGPMASISKMTDELGDQVRIVPLNVSDAFHSRYMKHAADAFAGFLDAFTFSSLQIPVISSVTALPYEKDQIAGMLSRQITEPVKWTDTIQWLMDYGVTDFEEIGSTVLTKMHGEIQKDYQLSKAAKANTQPASQPVTQVISQKQHSASNTGAGNTTRPTRLFMLHYAGGSQFSFQFFASHLKHFQLYLPELPGRGKRAKEPLLYNFTGALDDLYDQIIEDIEPGRDIIYGHSLGAILGFWLTERLERAGRQPKYLLVSGNPSPFVRKTELLQSLYQLQEQEFINVLKEMGGMPAAFFENKDLFRYYEPIIRADMKLLHSMSGSVPETIDTPVMAIMGTKEKSAFRIQEWSKYTRGHFDFKFLEGDHFFIHDHPETISALLSKAALS